MVWPLVIAGVAGAWAARSRAPKTGHRKYTSFGPRTGNVWDVELFPELGILAVRKNATVGTFRSHEGRIVFLRGKGDPNLIAKMREDFTAGAEPARGSAPTGPSGPTPR